jgi:hypothetical protein
MRSITCDICNTTMDTPWVIVTITKHVSGSRSDMDVCGPMCLEDLGRYMGMSEDTEEVVDQPLTVEPPEIPAPEANGQLTLGGVGDVAVDPQAKPTATLRYLNPDEINKVTGVRRRS